MNSWDDPNFVTAVKATDRKKIVLAGLWTDVCVAFPFIQAIADGYEVYVVEDLCGDLDIRIHDAAMRHIFLAMTFDERRSHWDLKYGQGLPCLEKPDPFYLSAFDQFVADLNGWRGNLLATPKGEKQNLEVDSERRLSGTISRILRRLRSSQLPE
jgi:hypothetical protein